MAKTKVRYRSLLDSMDYAIVALKTDLSILYCNEVYARLAGRTAEELEGQKLLDLFPEGEDTLSYLTYLEVLETGRTRVIEHKTGNRHFIERIYKTPGGILCAAEDISASKRSEKAVRAFAANHRRIFDDLNDAVIIHEVQSNTIIDINRTAAEMFGYGREEMLQHNIGDLVAGEAPYTSDNLLEWLKKSSELKTLECEYRCRDKSGRIFWADIKSKRMVIGDEVCLVAVIKDISRQKYLEKDLRESQERYIGLFDHAADFMFVHDLKGNFISVNHAAEQVTGYWPEELLKMNIAQLAVPQSEPMIRSIKYAKLSKNESKSYELEIQSKFDTSVFLDVRIWPVYKEARITAVQGIARDITAHKLAESKLKKSQQELSSFIHYLPDATMAIDLEGKVVAWNQAMERLTGIKAVDMLGKGDYEYGLAFYNSRRPIMVDLVLRPEEVKKYYSVIEQDNFTVISEFDTPHLRGEGHYLWGQAMPWYNQEGELIGAIESLRDITQRYKSDQNKRVKYLCLKKQVEHCQTLIEIMNGFCCSYKRDGTIVLASKSLRDALGFGEELLGQDISCLLSEEQRKVVDEAVMAKHSAGDLVVLGIEFCGPDGTQYLFQVKAFPVWENGEMDGILLKVVEKGE